MFVFFVIGNYQSIFEDPFESQWKSNQKNIFLEPIFEQKSTPILRMS